MPASRNIPTLIAALALAIVILFPVYWMFVTSLLPTTIVLTRDPPLLPPLASASFAAYGEVFARRPVLTWFLNSVAVTSGSVVIALLASTLAGEFAFSISLSVALLYLGVVAKGLDTGRYRARNYGYAAGHCDLLCIGKQ